MRFLADFLLAVGDFIEAECGILHRRIKRYLVGYIVLFMGAGLLLFGLAMLALGLFLLLASSVGYGGGALIVGGAVCLIAIILILSSNRISRS